MPFITAKMSKELNDSQVTALKAKFGEAIALFPGKSESWLMCEIETGNKMYFKGSDEDCAFIEVKIFGDVSASASEKFTAEICGYFGSLGINPSRVYIRYEGGTSWGWNGSNF